MKNNIAGVIIMFGLEIYVETESKRNINNFIYCTLFIKLYYTFPPFGMVPRKRSMVPGAKPLPKGQLYVCS